MVKSNLQVAQGDIIEFKKTGGRGRFMKGFVIDSTEKSIDILRTTNAERMTIKPETVQRVITRHKARRTRSARTA